MDIENPDNSEEQLDYLEENVIKKIETANNAINAWKEFMESNIKQRKYTDTLRRNLEETVIQDHNQTFIAHEDDELEQQTLYLKKIENKEVVLQQDISNMELKFSNMKNTDSDKIETQNKVIQKYRDLCKVSSVLTKTIFNFQSSNVSGAILNSNKQIQVFNFNPKKLHENDITKYLWKYMSLASGQELSTVVHK